jgi:L-galactonate dehydratase
MQHLKEFKPWFIEEPTSPDDVLGHKAIREALKPDGICVATGLVMSQLCAISLLIKKPKRDVPQSRDV